MKNLLRSLLFSALPLCSAVTFDSNLQAIADPTNLKTNSYARFCLNIKGDIEGGHKWLVSNKMFCSLDRIPTFSVAGGLRHKINNHAVGHYMFGNFSNRNGILIKQYGTGIDVTHKHYEIRTNYYHPNKTKDAAKYFQIFVHQRIDAELILKMKRLNVGVGPVFNLTSKNHGMQGRISIPFSGFTVGSLFHKDMGEPMRFSLITTFNLFGNDSPDNISTPSIYSHLPSLHMERLKPDKKHEDALSYVEEVNRYITEIEMLEGVKPPITKPTTWGEWFHSFFSPVTVSPPARASKVINPLTTNDRLKFEWESSPNVNLPDNKLSGLVISIRDFWVGQWTNELTQQDTTK